jgi:hypothetical protein
MIRAVAGGGLFAASEGLVSFRRRWAFGAARGVSDFFAAFATFASFVQAKYLLLRLLSLIFQAH